VSVLQLCYSVLQCIAVGCSVLQGECTVGGTYVSVLQCVAVCCSAFQCVPVCCSGSAQ